MDPLSVIASVIAIIGAANSILKSVDQLKLILRAPETVLTLIDEILALRALLRDVEEAQDRLERDQSCRPNSDAALYNKNNCPAFFLYVVQASLKLDEIDGLINGKLMRGCVRPQHVRLRWLRAQPKVNALQNDLRIINSNLTTCLAAKILSNQVHLQQDIAQIAQKFTSDIYRPAIVHEKRAPLLQKQVSHLQTDIDNQHGTHIRAEDLQQVSGPNTPFNGIDQCDTSEIFHLATAGDINGMKTMFERGLASPNDVSYTFGYSVLHFAVDLEHVETIRFLLTQGADIAFANRLNLTVFDLAWNRILSKRTDDSTQYELSNIFSGATSQADQVESRRLTRLQQIILGLANVDFDLALSSASISEINATDRDGNTVLSWAARCADEHATRSLLRRGADYQPVSRFGSTALHYAAGARSPSCILPLLEAGADANRRNACLYETPLHVAALRHDEPVEFLSPLLSYGADVNACDHEGSSVLAFAIQANHARSAAYLLDNGADLDDSDKSGLTPVGLAVVYNNHALLKMLLKRGASMERLTESQETVLHLCGLYGDLDTVAVLSQEYLTLSDDELDAQGQRASDYARLRGDDFHSAFIGLVATLKSL